MHEQRRKIDLHPNDSLNEQDQPPPHGIKPLPFTKFDDVAAFAAKRWIMKGMIARGETSSWIGPPKSGKSSVLDDLAARCAQGKDWCGYRAMEACRVLIIALERGDLHKRRFAVYQKRDGL